MFYYYHENNRQLLYYSFNQVSRYKNDDQIVDGIVSRYKCDSDKCTTNIQTMCNICSTLTPELSINIFMSIAMDDIDKITIWFTNPGDEKTQIDLLKNSALFCAIKCFNFLSLNIKSLPSFLINLAIRGENLEIIHICQNRNLDPNNDAFSYLSCIDDWLLYFYSFDIFYIMYNLLKNKEICTACKLISDHYKTISPKIETIPSNEECKKCFISACDSILPIVQFMIMKIIVQLNITIYHYFLFFTRIIKK